ncbi:lysylphosphatidylglycerol synthase transmembrane domain-containing protein [Phycisphaerales bacterium AB-hyl4]|uniref:Lysylphosphatidylglycerol synthase transmembrane domain-containing protein n=1 Tax=Natronomicrosphaera hydrolytica TaxID=3242702 RepID=A0ABV4U7J2_9BACT
MYKPITRILRITLGLTLLAWVLSRADWRELATLLQQIHLGWLAAFAITTPITVALSVWKWKLLLHPLGHHPRFSTLFGLYILSQFYNNLFPSSVGGDAVRAVMLGKRINAYQQALASIIVERFLGLTVLVALGLIAIALASPLRQHPPLLTLTLAGLGLYSLVTIIIFDPRLLQLTRRLTHRFRVTHKPLDKLHRFQQSLRDYRRHRTAIVKALLLSLAFHLGTIVNVYLACRALGEPVPWWPIALITPIALIVTMLPISFNGVGVREWTFMVGFQLLGLSPTLGVAASLLVRFKQLLWSSLGLLVHLTLPTTAYPSPPPPRSPRCPTVGPPDPAPPKNPSTFSTKGSTHAG